MRNKSSSSYVKKIKTFQFISSLCLLADVLPHLSILSKQFQKNDLDFGAVRPALNATKTTLEQLQVQKGPQEQNFHDLLANLRHRGIISFDHASETDQNHFCAAIREPYLQALLSCLDQRFPDLPLVSALQIFVPTRIPRRKQLLATYGNDDLTILLGQVSKAYAIGADQIPPMVDPVATHHEWTHLKSLFFAQPHLQQAGTPQTFIQLLKKHHGTSLPNLLKLADWGLAIPFATADCERDFSRLQVIKTDLRNRLKNETLCHLMRVSLDGPGLRDFPFVKALQLWHAMKPRRLPKGSALRGL